MKLKIIVMISIILFCSSCVSKHTQNFDSIRIPFTLENNRIVIEATVNHKKGRFVFDTGSTESYLDINADNLSIAGTTITDYEGERPIVPVYHLNEITFGEHIVKANSWVVNRSDLVKRSQSEGFDGILGALVFEGYWCELSFSKREIILHKRKPDYDWHDAQAKILFGKYNADFFIPVEIDQTIYYFDIDTGMPYGIYCPDTIIQGKTPDDYYTVDSNDWGVQKYNIVRANFITILDETYRDKLVFANSIYSARENAVYKDLGLLGVDFLKYYDFLFDFNGLSEGETTGLYVNPIDPVNERNYGVLGFINTIPEFGILNTSYIRDAFFVCRVIEDSIAYKEFHIRPGMYITKINGEEINASLIEQLVYTSFYQNVKDYSYKYKTDDVEQTIIVKTEDTAE